jgi:hypothetical protein
VLLQESPGDDVVDRNGLSRLMPANIDAAGVECDEPRCRILSGLARPSALAPFRCRNDRFQRPADLLTSWAVLRC